MTSTQSHFKNHTASFELLVPSTLADKLEAATGHRIGSVAIARSKT